MNKILLFLFGIAFLHPLFAQDTITSKKPKIGLVLSGGGAKGFAHIGVLKILEKAGVKIDFIGGTSMGAVVGGLYASGYNATQIDSIFSNTDFDQLIQDYIPRSSKSFFEKRNDEMYALTLPFNKFKVGVPLAFSRGMYNYCLLSRLTHKVRFVRDFDKLPIPFFCVATDIEKGEQVLLKNGYLAQAIFASSAFPSLYSPVEIDGKLMIDGGVINNYPVEEIRKMGADIVIGVDVQDDLKDRSSLNDASKILVQISNIDMIKVMEKKIKLTDIYIKPKVSEFGVISFVDGKEIQMKGELAATAVFEQLKKLADSSYTFKLNNIKTKKEYLQFKSISINKLESYTRSYVLGKLRIKNDQKISYQDIEDGINNLNATHNFNSISYSIEGSDNAEELKLNLSENTIKTFLKFGLHYDGLYKSAALANFTNKKILFKNDVASLDVGLGDNIRYNFDYYIDNGFYWSFGIKSRFNSFARGIKTDFSNGNLLSQLSLKTININFSDLTNQAYLQTVFIQKFLIGAGLEHKYLNIISENLQPPNSIIERSSYASVFGYMKYDSFDNKLFPKKGWLLATDIQSYLYSTDYTKRFNKYSVAKAELGIVKTINNNISFKLQTDVGFAFGDSSIEFFDFILGGYGFDPINNFKHFYGYDFLSISGDSFIKSCFTIDYEIYKKNHINLAANYANIGDNLFANKDWLSKPQHTGYAIGYGLESVIGPIEIKYSWSPELRSSFTYVSVGFWF